MSTSSAQELVPSPDFSPPQQQNDELVLYISARSVGRYVPTPASVLNDQDVASMYNVLPATAAPDALLGLLTGKLSDFNEYAGVDGSAWLLDIAHGICDPRHERGRLLVYDPQQKQWTSVDPLTPLLAASYLYYLPPGHQLRSLTKMCPRGKTPRSLAEYTTGKGNTMLKRLCDRDGRCWVTGLHQSTCDTSHICPKRLGDALAKRILEDFARGMSIPAHVSIYDPIFGLLLSCVLRGYFAKFEIGFKYRGPNVYECHDFWKMTCDRPLSIAGSLGPKTVFQAPLLHGFTTTPPNPQADNLPPPGVFRWHYIQCVVQKFRHPQYKDFENIFLPMIETPFESDDSGDSDDYV